MLLKQRTSSHLYLTFHKQRAQTQISFALWISCLRLTLSQLRVDFWKTCKITYALRMFTFVTQCILTCVYFVISILKSSLTCTLLLLMHQNAIRVSCKLNSDFLLLNSVLMLSLAFNLSSTSMIHCMKKSLLIKLQLLQLLSIINEHLLPSLMIRTFSSWTYRSIKRILHLSHRSQYVSSMLKYHFAMLISCHVFKCFMQNLFALTSS